MFKEQITRIAITLLRMVYRSLFITPKPRFIPASGIIAVWHDEMLGIFRYFKNTGAMVMVSHSKDGKLAVEERPVSDVILIKAKK